MDQNGNPNGQPRRFIPWQEYLDSQRDNTFAALAPRNPNIADSSNIRVRPNAYQPSDTRRTIVPQDNLNQGSWIPLRDLPGPEVVQDTSTVQQGVGQGQKGEDQGNFGDETEDSSLPPQQNVEIDQGCKPESSKANQQALDVDEGRCTFDINDFDLKEPQQLEDEDENEEFYQGNEDIPTSDPEEVDSNGEPISTSTELKGKGKEPKRQSARTYTDEEVKNEVISILSDEDVDSNLAPIFTSTKDKGKKLQRITDPNVPPSWEDQEYYEIHKRRKPITRAERQAQTGVEVGCDGWIPKGKVIIAQDKTLQWEDEFGRMIPAVYHNTLRPALIGEMAKLGSYLKPRARGLGKWDVTSFHPDQKTWGPSREHDWPHMPDKLLFRLECEGYPVPTYEVPDWYDEGRIVIDRDNHPLRKYANIPLTLSSNADDWLMEYIRRQDTRITLLDFRARMPHVRVTLRGNETPLGTINVISMALNRFRLREACPTWIHRQGSDRIVDYIKSLLSKEGLAANSTEELPGLNMRQQRMYRELNKGRFPNRAGGRALSPKTRAERDEKEERRAAKREAREIAHPTIKHKRIFPNVIHDVPVDDSEDSKSSKEALGELPLSSSEYQSNPRKRSLALSPTNQPIHRQQLPALADISENPDKVQPAKRQRISEGNFPANTVKQRPNKKHLYIPLQGGPPISTDDSVSSSGHQVIKENKLRAYPQPQLNLLTQPCTPQAQRLRASSAHPAPSSAYPQTPQASYHQQTLNANTLPHARPHIPANLHPQQPQNPSSAYSRPPQVSQARQTSNANRSQHASQYFTPNLHRERTQVPDLQQYLQTHAQQYRNPNSQNANLDSQTLQPYAQQPQVLTYPQRRSSSQVAGGLHTTAAALGHHGEYLPENANIAGPSSALPIGMLYDYRYLRPQNQRDIWAVQGALQIARDHFLRLSGVEAPATPATESYMHQHSRLQQALKRVWYVAGPVPQLNMLDGWTGGFDEWDSQGASNSALDHLF